MDFGKADRTLRGLKATGKRFTISLGNSITCTVGSTGSRTLYFSQMVDGKMKRHMLGHYPATTFTEAFEKARALHAENRNAVGRPKKIARAAAQTAPEEPLDPAQREAEEKRAARIAARPKTVAELAERFIAEHVAEKNRTKWAIEVERYIRKDSLPLIGHMSLSEIQRADITDVIDAKKREVQAKGGAGVAANRLAAALQKMFTWSAQKGFSAFELGLRLERPIGEVARDRVLTPKEIGQLWNALEKARHGSGTLHRDYASVIQILMLGGARQSEVSGPDDPDIDGLRACDVDFEERTFEVRKGKTKASERVVAMPPKMLEIVTEAAGRAKSPDTSLFLKPEGGEIDSNAVSKAAVVVRDAIGHAGYTARDIRRTATTILGDIGVDSDLKRMVTGHAAKDVHGKVYDRSRRVEAVRAALQKVEDHVLKCAAKADENETAGVESWGK
jgi:integrase